MPAGWPGGPARGGPPRRFIAAACGLCLALIAAACTAGTGLAGHPAPASHAAPAPPPRTAPRPPSARAATALRITPAPYLLPSPIAREVVLARGGDLLIAGGLTRASVSTDAISVLNPVTGRVTRAGRLARPGHDAAGALLAGRAYVFGGGAAASVADVQALRRHGTARVAGRLPKPRSDTSAVTIGGTAYLLGGYDGASYDARVLATTDGRHFRGVTTLPVPVRYPAVAGAGTRIWVFGGQTRSGLTDAVQQVSLATGKAAVVGHLPDPVTGAAAFVLGDRVYVAGGQVLPRGRHGLDTSGDVLAFDPRHDAVAPAGRLPVPVANAAAAVLAGTAYLVGGNNGLRQVPTVTELRPPVRAIGGCRARWPGPGQRALAGARPRQGPPGAALRPVGTAR